MTHIQGSVVGGVEEWCCDSLLCFNSSTWPWEEEISWREGGVCRCLLFIHGLGIRQTSTMHSATPALWSKGLAKTLCPGLGRQERGISGGQRKRVNIGLELAARPTVLYLDEQLGPVEVRRSDFFEFRLVPTLPEVINGGQPPF